MKATEFRITNLAKDKLTGEVLICCGLECEANGSNSKISFTVLDRSKYPLPEGWQAEPIYLTDVWLIKFGFHYDLDRSEFFKEFNNSALYMDSDYTAFIAGDEICQLRHVHQLQNLYHALTGKELSIC